MGFRRYQKTVLRVGYSGGHLIFSFENMPSARAHGHVVVEYLAKKLKCGSIAGPFSAPPVHKLHFNRFGLVPKSEPGQWRMIIVLSFPSGFSVNDGIPDSEAHVKFSSVDDAIDMIIRCGRGCLMAKFDIKAASEFC